MTSITLLGEIKIFRTPTLLNVQVWILNCRLNSGISLYVVNVISLWRLLESVNIQNLFLISLKLFCKLLSLMSVFCLLLRLVLLSFILELLLLLWVIWLFYQNGLFCKITYQIGCFTKNFKFIYHKWFLSHKM